MAQAPMKKNSQEILDKWGYPKNRDHDFSNPEGNFATGVALVIAFVFIATVIVFHVGNRI